ncbi:MAG: energy-dependent translational throttle protein EttA [Thermoleophilia bacterium]|jgi:ATP-binding cassette ChvD family protein|nr:energy-dependent translational throttle protein EttA [Thermoleophilia bacterium]
MSTPQFIYTMYKVDKFHGPEKHILKEVSLSFIPGAKIGVLGANGAGKSTLLKMMAGIEEASSGEMKLHPGASVGYLSQEPDLDESKDVRGNVEDGLGELRDLLKRFEELSMKFAEPMTDDEMAEVLEEQGRVQDKIEKADAWDIDRRLDIAMDALRLPPGDAAVANLSGGEKRRVALCRLLLSSPDLLLLDEPTNHLDAESVAWLERFLHDYEGCVIAVTHDRYFLDNVAGWILEIDRGRCHPFEGNYSGWLEQKQARLALEEKQGSARQRTLAKELEWVRASPKARQAKSKARLAAYDDMLAEEQNVKLDSVEIHIPGGPRLGDVVVRAENVRKAFGDKLLVEDLSFNLPPNGIVGIVGPNGAGKTTLFRMIAGQETVDGGGIVIGETVQMAYVDQSRADLDPDKNIWEEISDGLDLINVGKREMPSRQYVASFNFKGADQQKLVGKLSGGERNRVHLAKLLKSGGNLLLLDEPTNDLDVDTLRALEVALNDFPGCAVVITHDRWFLDRVATHILAFEGDSQVTWFEGSYGEYEEHRQKQLGADANTPHRIKYKPITRD